MSAESVTEKRWRMANDQRLRQITTENGRTVYINVLDIRAFYNFDSRLIIEMIDGTSYNVNGAPNVNTFYAATFAMDPVETSITSVPPLTIADIVNLNIDSMPTININQGYTTSTPSQGQVNVSNVSVTILAANANRKKVLLRNQHLSGDVYIFLGTPATLINGMLLLNGETYTFPEGFTYTGVITAIGISAAAKPVGYVEWT